MAYRPADNQNHRQHPVIHAGRVAVSCIALWQCLPGQFGENGSDSSGVNDKRIGTGQTGNPGSHDIPGINEMTRETEARESGFSNNSELMM